jgi:hypothetical protein
MNIEQFATTMRVKVRRHEDGELIIPGKLGHVYQHDEATFGLVLEAPPHDTRLDNTLRARRRTALREGFEIHQEGDIEAILLFDSNNAKQARLAVRLVGAKRKRRPGGKPLTPARARELVEIRRSKRQEAVVAT